MIVMSMLTAPRLAAQWSFDYHQFPYDMTIYATVTLDDSPIDQDRYTLGAFVGDECRGIAEPLSISGVDNPPLYLRVYSSVTSDETITFKLYDNEKGTAVTGCETEVAFVKDSAVGTPSSPQEIVFTSATLGDVNGDGRINITDAVVLASYLIGDASDDFVIGAADVNGDGTINITDVVFVVELALNWTGF